MERRENERERGMKGKQVEGWEGSKNENVHLIACLYLYDSHPLLSWCRKLQNICRISMNKPLGPRAHVSRLQAQTANTTIHTITVT